MASSADRYVVISTDTHGGAAPGDYRPFVDAAHLDEFDAWVDTVAPEVARTYQSFISGQVRDGWNGEGDAVKFLDDIHDRAVITSDATSRVKVMEQQGYVGAVVYAGTAWLPSPFQHFSIGDMRAMSGGSDGREMRWVSSWTYNRWLADFCGQYPERFAGIINVPDYDDLDQSMALIRWGADSGLRGGIQMPRWNLDLPGFHEDYWTPLWDLCQERSLPVNVHGGYGMDPRIYGAPTSRTVYFTFFESLPSSRPLFLLMLGGVFDRSQP